MYYVGIDIAKFKHDCCIVSDNGEIIEKPFSIANNREGFNTLLSKISLLLKDQLRIGFESTGHYTSNLKSFLNINGYTFMEMNPLLVSKKIKSTSLRRTKTDSADSLAIATLLMTIEFKPYPTTLYQTSELKKLTRFRSSLIQSRSRTLIYLTNTLDLVFPEFKPLFNHRLGVTALYLLRKYKTPQRISKLTMRNYDEIRAVSFGQISHMKFSHLIDSAKHTVGASNETLLFELQQHLSTYDHYCEQIQNVESRILELMKNVNTHIDTIPGISTLMSASIVAEFGDISLFDSPNKMLSFAGIEPSVNQSGQSNFNGRMVKHGSSYLRYILMFSAESTLPHIPEFYAYYTKKREEGKKHWVAISHLAKKLVRIIFALEKNQIKFTSSY